jgi:hypothetical protein
MPMPNGSSVWQLLKPGVRVKFVGMRAGGKSDRTKVLRVYLTILRKEILYIGYLLLIKQREFMKNVCIG